MGKCVWMEKDTGYLLGQCGFNFSLSSGTPSDNSIKFCPGCGNEVEVNVVAEGNLKVIRAYRTGGWSFKYEDSTKFIGVNHPRGGKQSVCEISNGLNQNIFGEEIARFLNYC